MYRVASGIVAYGWGILLMFCRASTLQRRDLSIFAPVATSNTFPDFIVQGIFIGGILYLTYLEPVYRLNLS